MNIEIRSNECRWMLCGIRESVIKRCADAGEENPYRWQSLTSGDLFKDRRIVLFALPGAFTPTCSAKQLPMYEQNFMAV